MVPLITHSKGRWRVLRQRFPSPSCFFFFVVADTVNEASCERVAFLQRCRSSGSSFLGVVHLRLEQRCLISVRTLRHRVATEKQGCGEQFFSTGTHSQFPIVLAVLQYITKGRQAIT